jgi:choline dehydrogenase-like flavoprotein
MRKAWRELGIPQQKEGAGGDAYGVFWLPSSQDPKTQTRSYGRTAHYDPVANRSNYHLLVGHKVNEIILDGEAGSDNAFKATGLKIQAVNGKNATVIELKSRHEIILAAGAVHTPGILQRSGIGPQDILRAANITTKVELPGVGQNFQDHPLGNLFYERESDPCEDTTRKPALTNKQ